MHMRLTIVRLALVALLFLMGLAVIAGVSRTSAQTPPQGWANYIVVLRDAVPDTDGEINRIEQASQHPGRVPVPDGAQRASQ